jgi:hypothetical protein
LKGYKFQGSFNASDIKTDKNISVNVATASILRENWKKLARRKRITTEQNIISVTTMALVFGEIVKIHILLTVPPADVL